MRRNDEAVAKRKALVKIASSAPSGPPWFTFCLEHRCNDQQRSGYLVRWDKEYRKYICTFNLRLEEDNMQEQNELCGCHSGAKYGACCGRFSPEETASKLGNFIGNHRRKNTMIKLGLKLLAAREAIATERYLCLANPKPDAEGFIDWTVVEKSIPADEQGAVVTRRVLAGYLPLGCLLRNPEWSMILDKSLVPEELHDVYIAFARTEMNFIAATIDGKLIQTTGL